jgi:hypothetical protein
LGQRLRRAEPKWQKPGDVEAAFFVLHDALRSKRWVRSRRERTPISTISHF